MKWRQVVRLTMQKRPWPWLSNIFTIHCLRPDTINPQISEALERIILKSLAKNREERYWTCGEMVQAIQSLETAPPKSESTTIEAFSSIDYFD